MKYHQMTKNYIFRELECGLTVEQTAKLCFKTVRTVKKWDEGNDIPPECKRLMRFYKSREIGHDVTWEGFRISRNELILPTGKALTPKQILTGAALLEIQAPNDTATITTLMKYARMIENSIKKS